MLRRRSASFLHRVAAFNRLPIVQLAANIYHRVVTLLQAMCVSRCEMRGILGQYRILIPQYDGQYNAIIIATESTLIMPLSRVNGPIMHL